MKRVPTGIHTTTADASAVNLPTHADHVEPKGRIEVTVQGLDGIWIDSEKNERPSLPWVTATVAFSGSASNMEVGSSSVCGVTGQLVVESEPVTISSSTLLSKNPRLAAQWLEEKKDGVGQPHLTMEFANHSKEITKKSLEKGTYGAKLVKRDLETSQTDSTASASTTSSTLEEEDDDCDCESRSAAWSESGDNMPEIIEMYVRLRHDDDAVDSLWDGVAFLVIYGHEEDRGTHCLELPVQRTTFRSANSICRSIRTDASSRNHTRMLLSDEARLTIQVKVVPCRPTPSKPVASSIVASSASTSSKLKISQTAVEEELGPLLQKLSQSEELAKQLRENQKRAMNVDVPSYPRDQPLPRPPPETGSFCHVPILSQWAHALSQMASMAVRCDSHNDDDDDVNRDENSTIATRDSMRLFW